MMSSEFAYKSVLILNIEFHKRILETNLCQEKDCTSVVLLKTVPIFDNLQGHKIVKYQCAVLLVHSS